MTDSTHDQLSAQDMLKRVFQIAEIAANSDVDMDESFAAACTKDKNRPKKHEDAVSV
ncbi:MAG: hypothetical protein KC547_20240 [Anaerolineae bacterium]|nr:hypothetical protein [Anaerolineae bacterium]